MTYLSTERVYFPASDFLASLDGKRLRWQLPNSLMKQQGDLDAVMKCLPFDETGRRVCVEIFGGVLLPPGAANPGRYLAQPYRLYLTQEALALVKPEPLRRSLSDFCAIAPPEEEAS